MSKITAADVNKLRKSTGAGIMDCKKALVEANGDFELAIENLRKKGQKVAAKRSDRESSEGAVIAKVNSDSNSGVIISLNCETDFVAKNESFISLANQIAELALISNTKEELLETKIESMSVQEKLILILLDLIFMLEIKLLQLLVYLTISMDHLKLQKMYVCKLRL